MDLKYFTNIKTLKLETTKCTGCNICVQVCPHDVFEMNDTAKKVEIINLDSCMECGACKLNCQFNALDVESGVGCVAAVINGFIRNSEPNCGCSDDDGGNNCC